MDVGILSAYELKTLCLQSHEYSFLLELTFLSAIANYHIGEKEDAFQIFKVCYYSSHSMNNIFFNIIKFYVFYNLHLQKNLNLIEKEDISLPSLDYIVNPNTLSDYKFKKIIETVEIYQLGDLIHDLRKECKISQSELCYGLCSKSKLSKIENNTLIPKNYLIKTLFQRMGIYSESLLFYTNAKDFEISELKNKFTFSIVKQDYKIAQTLLEQLESICHDNINQQFIYMGKALLNFTSKTRLLLFQDALKLTLPNFRIENICTHNLSYNELTIINNIALCYANAEQTLISINYLHKIMEYFASHNIDIQEKCRLFTSTLLALSSRLYDAKCFDEFIELFEQANFSMNTCSHSTFSNFCALKELLD